MLSTRPDVVIDMVCFEPESAETLVAGVAGRVDRLISCGTIWVHGPTLAAPTRESDERHPYGEYGTKKAAIERIVLESDVPSTVLKPGRVSRIRRGATASKTAFKHSVKSRSCCAKSSAR